MPPDPKEALLLKCRVCNRTSDPLAQHISLGIIEDSKDWYLKGFLTAHAFCQPPIAGETLLERFQLVVKLVD